METASPLTPVSRCAFPKRNTYTPDLKHLMFYHTESHILRLLPPQETRPQYGLLEALAHHYVGSGDMFPTPLCALFTGRTASIVRPAGECRSQPQPLLPDAIVITLEEQRHPVASHLPSLRHQGHCRRLYRRRLVVALDDIFWGVHQTGICPRTR